MERALIMNVYSIYRFLNFFANFIASSKSLFKINKIKKKTINFFLILNFGCALF